MSSKIVRSQPCEISLSPTQGPWQCAGIVNVLIVCICYGTSVYYVNFGINERKAQDLMLEESRLGVRLKTAKADAKTASLKAKHSAHRLGRADRKRG